MVLRSLGTSSRLEKLCFYPRLSDRRLCSASLSDRAFRTAARNGAASREKSSSKTQGGRGEGCVFVAPRRRTTPAPPGSRFVPDGAVRRGGFLDVDWPDRALQARVA
jgi:hypothetical protein